MFYLLPLTHPTIPTNQPNNQTTKQPINQPTNQSTNQSINQFEHRSETQPHARRIHSRKSTIALDGCNRSVSDTVTVTVTKKKQSHLFFFVRVLHLFLVSVDKRFICFSFLLFVRFSLLSFVFHGEVLGLGKLYSPPKKSCSAYHCA